MERTQKAALDVTEWLAWFLATLHRAVDQAQHTLDAMLVKTRFWQRWAAPGSAPLNERQVKLVNQLLDGFEGKLTSSLGLGERRGGEERAGQPRIDN